MNRNRIGVSLSVLAIATLLAAGLVSAAPAGAAVQPANCPFTNTLCLFDGTNFTGERFTASAFDPAGVCVDLADHGWGDRPRSAINTHSKEAQLHRATDCSGISARVPGKSSLPTLPMTNVSGVFVASLLG